MLFLDSFLNLSDYVNRLEVMRSKRQIPEKFVGLSFHWCNGLANQVSAITIIILCLGINLTKNVCF